MNNESQIGGLVCASRRLKSFRGWTLLTIVSAAGLIAAACGGGDSEEEAAQPSQSSTANATVTAGPTGDSTLKVVGKDIAFDRTELVANSGAIQIEFDNQDNAIPHNFHVFRGNGSSGESIDLTTITSGPVVQRLDLQLEAGTYFFQCDVHPNQMKGTLAVN